MKEIVRRAVSFTVKLCTISIKTCGLPIRRELWLVVSALAIVVSSCYLVLTWGIVGGEGTEGNQQLGTIAQQIAVSCQTTDPILAAAEFFPTSPESPRGGEMSAVGFSKAHNVLRLASQASTGAVYGLAYDAIRGHLYAAAFHKRANMFGPAGPGAIYDVDLNTVAATGTVSVLSRIGAGVDEHAYNDRSPFSDRSGDAVGRSSLGDLEFDDRSDALFVTNLYDRRIYRISASSGHILGSFPQGASHEPWAGNARPMGLGYKDGWLYHGVVDSRRTLSGARVAVRPSVTEFRGDGSEMAEVVSFDFSYSRTPTWEPWSPIGEGKSRARNPVVGDRVSARWQSPDWDTRYWW